MSDSKLVIVGSGGRRLVPEDFTGKLRIICSEEFLLYEALFREGAVLCSYSVDSGGEILFGEDASSLVEETLATNPSNCFVELFKLAPVHIGVLAGREKVPAQNELREKREGNVIETLPLEAIDATRLLLHAKFLKNMSGALSEILEDLSVGVYLSCREPEGREIRILIDRDGVKSTVEPLYGDSMVECKVYKIEG